MLHFFKGLSTSLRHEVQRRRMSFLEEEKRSNGSLGRTENG